MDRLSIVRDVLDKHRIPWEDLVMAMPPSYIPGFNFRLFSADCALFFEEGYSSNIKGYASLIVKNGSHYNSTQDHLRWSPKKLKIFYKRDPSYQEIEKDMLRITEQAKLLVQKSQSLWARGIKWEASKLGS